MKVIPFSLESTGYYSKLMIDYISDSPKLSMFYGAKLNYDNIEEIIEERNKYDCLDRSVLVEVLKEQYNLIETSVKTKENINRLSDKNTYTITTGHQVNLMTGPVYFIYKIASCIKLCNELSKKKPQYNFIPIYWMNSEDHDIEEINHFNLFGKKIEWNLEWEGASGKMPTESLNENVFSKLKEILGESEKASSIIKVLEDCYLKEENLERATFKFVNFLFKEYGLVILNQQNAKLKYSVRNIIVNELLNNENENSVNTLSDKLITNGYHAQVKPRPLNLFMFHEGKRERIEKLESGNYKLSKSNKIFSIDELKELLLNSSEKFSFNVVTRTLYQQYILPNLAYIGGGGELAYWLQYKTMFEKNKLFFPALILRNTILWISNSNNKKLDKAGLTINDLFKNVETLKKNHVNNNTSVQLNLEDEKKAFKLELNKIKEKALGVDRSLEKMIDAELGKMLGQLEKLEAKMLRAEKKKFEHELNKIENVKEVLFPNNNLQERVINFIEIWFTYGLNFIDELIEVIEPNQEEFSIIIEN